MNPAALKTNLADLKRGGTLILNEDAFDRSNLSKAGYATNPLEDNSSLAGYRIHKVPMTRLTRDAVDGLGLRRARRPAPETSSRWASFTGCTSGIPSRLCSG